MTDKPEGWLVRDEEANKIIIYHRSCYPNIAEFFSAGWSLYKNRKARCFQCAELMPEDTMFNVKLAL